jgi:hypothetical protein
VAITAFAVVASPALAREKKAITIIKKVAAKEKLSAADTKALIVLARRESGYNANCVTGNCVGLFQITLTKYNHNKWRDPYFNTRMAIKQIKHRYKTPRKALAHSYSNGWY